MSNNSNSNNTEKDIKQNHKNFNISNSTGVVVGENNRVGDIINITNIIQEIEDVGLNFLTDDFFQLNKSSQKDFDDWKHGFRFELPSIMEGLNFKRISIINDIIQKLDDTNGYHALLLVGKSGTSKSNLLMDIICHYYRHKFSVFYNFGVNEINDVFKLENFLRMRLKDGNKILVAIDDVHDKRNAAIFSVIDSLKSYTEKKDNIRFILTGRQPEFDRFVNDRLNEIHSEDIRRNIRKLSPRLRYNIPNFDQKEIKEFIKKYKNEEEIKSFLTQKYNINYKEYDKLFVDEDQVTTISFQIYKETESGYPILVKFLLFGKGLYEDMKKRYDNYLSNSILKLQTVLICGFLELSNITITNDLLSNMEIISYARELKDQILIFSTIEKKWKTLHLKWNLELLTYLFSVEDDFILEKRINILNQSLLRLFTTIKNEKDQYFIIGSLYDSTTINTEQHKTFPINIIEQVITNSEISYVDKMGDHWKFNLYNNYIAKNYYYLKQYTKSFDAIEKVFNIYPNNKSIILNKGITLSSLGKEEDAIEYFDKGINLDPTDVIAWYNKGHTLGKLGRYEEAIVCYDKIIDELNPQDVEVWYDKGIALGKLGRYDDEIMCYDKVVYELDLKHISSWYNRGIAFTEFGDNVPEDAIIFYEEAIVCYDKIIDELNPKHISAFLNKGSVLFKLGKTEDAIEYFKKTLEIETDNPNNKVDIASKGYALLNLKRYQEAIEYFDKALKIDPYYKDVLYYRNIAKEILQNNRNNPY